MKKAFSQARLREIIWDIGHRYPVPLTADSIALLAVTPRLGHVSWHVTGQSAHEASSLRDNIFANASPVVRVYDVTDIIFDGSNAHMYFDLDVGRLSGKHYFTVDRTERNYLAEIGLRSPQGAFRPLSRSNPSFFDRERPSGNYQTAGLFVGSSLNRMFPVENVFDARVYERMGRELSGVVREEALSIAVVFLGPCRTAGAESPLWSFIKNLAARFEKFGGHAQLFVPPECENRLSEGDLSSALASLSEKVGREVREAAGGRLFHIVHCHDWYSLAAGLALKRDTNIPMVLTLHSTEHERLHGNEMNRISAAICEKEKEAVTVADLVIVPHSSTRQQTISLYNADPEKVVIIPDVFHEVPAGLHQGEADVRGWFALDREAPTALFAGEISHASGADLLAEALPTVCRNHRTAQFLFAGDGPLKGELEARIRHAGIGHRCRFLGDLSRDTFEAVLGASDFVVIPARTWQDEGLAQMAISRGRPVLTTHQAGINCVSHGENGLVTFDNPGSIVWGIQELLHNPLKGSILRFAARKRSVETPSLEVAAVQHYTCYEMLLKKYRERQNA